MWRPKAPTFKYRIHVSPALQALLLLHTQRKPPGNARLIFLAHAHLNHDSSTPNTGTSETFEGRKTWTNDAAKYGHTYKSLIRRVWMYYKMLNCQLRVHYDWNQPIFSLEVILVIFLPKDEARPQNILIRAKPVIRRLGSSSPGTLVGGGGSSQKWASQQPLVGSTLITVANFRI